MNDRPMTWDEIFRAIKGGDIGVIIATTLEVAIMLLPVGILFGVWYAT